MTHLRRVGVRAHDLGSLAAGVPLARRDRRVPVRGVVCPTCDASPGEVCVTTAGTVLNGVHVPRRRLAIRDLVNRPAAGGAS